MRIGFFGDVFGRAGRRAISDHLDDVRRALDLEFIIINAENAAGGFGITEAIFNDLIDAGADVVTLGNHDFDQAEALTFIAREPRLLRPVNYPISAGVPGQGAGVFDAPGGRRVLVMNVQGRMFMDALDCPFNAVADQLDAAPLGEAVDALVVDMHAEATSEKYAMGHFCDGRASLVVGTHTHVPTADAQVLPGGTAYQTDAGMCGDYDSVIGMEKHEPVRRFHTRIRGERPKPADGEATLCGVFVQTDDATGLALRCAPIRVGGRLEPVMPSLVESVPAE